MKKFNIPSGATIKSIDGEYEESNAKGLLISTNKGDIKLILSDMQQCCEDHGHLFFDTPDKVDEFIGAKILAVKEIEVDLAKQIGKDYGERSESQLRIVTSRGDIQYAVYNDHNGYYAHAGICQVFDDTENFSL